MATTLHNVLQFNGLVVDAPITLPHGINLNGLSIAPDIVIPATGGFTIVANATGVTVTRTTGAAAVNVYVERWHSYERALPLPGQLVGLIPFVVEGGGGGGGSDFATITIGVYKLDNIDGVGGGTALRLANLTPNGTSEFQIWQENYSNPVTVVGGLVPGSDTDPLQPNFGTFQGVGTSINKFPVGFNGQTHPRYTIDILSDESNVTNDDYKILIAWAGSAGFDTTVKAIEGAGILSVANLNHENSGGFPLTAVAVHARATMFNSQVGDLIYALWCEEGEVRLDGKTTIALPAQRQVFTVNTDAAVFQGAATAAAAVAAGTLLDLRQNQPHNYLGFSNPDATDAGIVINNVSGGGDAYIVYTNAGGWLFGAQNGLRATLNGATFAMTGRVQANEFRQGASGPTWTNGAGTPEGAVAAPVGSLFSRTDGGAGTSLYVKESGTGTAGWIAK